MKPIELQPNETILAVVPQYVAGPGWTNKIIWIYIGDFSARTFRFESLQPEEQTETQQTLFSVAAQINDQMISSVKTKQVKATS